MIVTLGEFAYAIRRSTATAAQHQLLLELAEGLVVDEIGVRDSYSATVKAIVLDVATRAFWEREDAEEGSALKGVFLTDDEVRRLYGRAATGPQFAFPEAVPYPDPVEGQCREVIS